jgi:hypothetical protein
MVKKKRRVFKPAFAMSKQELSRQLSAHRIAAIEVTQEPDGSYWIGAKLQGLPETFFLATKRNVGAPRRFHRLDVIVAFLKRGVRFEGAMFVQLAGLQDAKAKKKTKRKAT